MTTITYSLSQLGWTPFFQQQISLDEWEHNIPARVVCQHRSCLELLTERGEIRLPLSPGMPPLTVGDWLLLDRSDIFARRLERRSLFSRRSPGSKVSEQLIAANVDTAFIVCSLNDDFSLNRIERYLALVREAGADPLVLLSRADQCPDADEHLQQVRALEPLLMAEAVNALDPVTAQTLAPWCQNGKTVALLGSSGVGKSTLINTLLADQAQQTGAIREADSKGRHTTTARSLHLMTGGGLLLDTPGMRELQLAGCEQGLALSFADIAGLAQQCRFADCQHQTEPGCAVSAAISRGQLDQRRLDSYSKLMREQAHNAATLAQRRARERDFARMCRTVSGEAKKRKREG
ncbi:ribosome small subunit-dependent GTPase A [Marinobacterium jannaschii]|uniref:ribosome small subunit-dependent GTPase A n=1 Tax=Marinobacterium jannaschii TaxID=64970 RepID=UPI000488788F|nr:ribosome small subunit-dependent GTPase A [Marinobacterium jannaschii]